MRCEAAEKSEEPITTGPDEAAPVASFVDSPEYLERLREFLAPLEGTDFFTGSWFSHTDTAHFRPYLDYVEQFSSLEGRDVLDLGAGTAGLLVCCLERRPRRLVGLEVDASLHALASARVAGTGIECVLSEGNGVSLPDASFDVIFTLHVIEHVRSPSAYLADVARLLRPGGLVLLTCPNRIWPHEPHGNVPFLPWLPDPLGRWFCDRAQRSSLVSPAIKQQLSTATLRESLLSFRSIRRLARASGLEILALNDPRRFVALEKIPLGAIGERLPPLQLAFHLLNTTLIRRAAAPLCRFQPERLVSRWGSLLLRWELEAVLQKPPTG